MLEIYSLITSLRNKEELTSEARIRISEFIMQFCSEHFQQEEQEMRIYHYPVFRKHCSEHEEIRQQIMKEDRYFLIARPSDLANFLSKVLLLHVTGADVDFAIWKLNVTSPTLARTTKATRDRIVKVIAGR